MCNDSEHEQPKSSSNSTNLFNGYYISEIVSLKFLSTFIMQTAKECWFAFVKGIILIDWYLQSLALARFETAFYNTVSLQ